MAAPKDTWQSYIRPDIRAMGARSASFMTDPTIKISIHPFKSPSLHTPQTNLQWLPWIGV